MLRLLFAVLLLGVVVLIVYGARSAGFGSSPAPATVNVNAAAAAAPTPAPGETSIEISQETLTSQLNQQLAGKTVSSPAGTATISSVRVQIRPGQMQTSGTAEVGGASVPITADETVTATGGRPVVKVTQARVAEVPLPDALRAQMEQQLQAQVDQTVQSQGLRVSSVTLEQGRIVVIGKRA